MTRPATLFGALALASPMGSPSVPRTAEPGAKLRLGLISAATYGYMGAPRVQGSNHGTAFSTCSNGYDEAKRTRFEGTFVAARKRVEGAQVVQIWDPVKAAAERLADVCGIPTVGDTAEECSEGVNALARGAPSLGEIHLATTICGNELVDYGIHALEMAYAVLGRGAVSCLNVGQPGRNIARVRFANGRDLLLMVAERREVTVAEVLEH